MKITPTISESDFKFFEITPETYTHKCVMLLAQDFVNGERRIPADAYTILDNGAAEGASVTNAELVNIIKRVKPNEFILPDMLGNKDETIKKTKEFVKLINDDSDIRCLRMAVIQGSNLNEFMQCTQEFLDDKELKIDVLGIPKHMVYTLRDMFARVKFVKWVNEKFPNIIIHLLGMNEPFYIIRQAVKQGARIRSCDSIVPYIYEKEDPGIPFDYYIRDTGKSYNEFTKK